MSNGKYTITLDEANQIVFVVVSGDIDKKLGEEIITSARIKATEHSCHILYNVTQANVKVSLTDWFFLPRTLPVLQNQKNRTIKAAVIILPGDQEVAYNFYETVTHNVGINLRVFTNEQEAIKWLKGK